jgi:hypothetical protein
MSTPKPPRKNPLARPGHPSLATRGPEANGLRRASHPVLPRDSSCFVEPKDHRTLHRFFATVRRSESVASHPNSLLCVRFRCCWWFLAIRVGPSPRDGTTRARKVARARIWTHLNGWRDMAVAGPPSNCGVEVRTGFARDRQISSERVSVFGRLSAELISRPGTNPPVR